MVALLGPAHLVPGSQYFEGPIVQEPGSGNRRTMGPSGYRVPVI